MKRPSGKSCTRSLAVIAVFAAALAACSAEDDAPRPGRARLMTYQDNVVPALLTVSTRDVPVSPGTM